MHPCIHHVYKTDPNYDFNKQGVDPAFALIGVVDFYGISYSVFINRKLGIGIHWWVLVECRRLLRVGEWWWSAEASYFAFVLKYI